MERKDKIISLTLYPLSNDNFGNPADNPVIQALLIDHDQFTCDFFISIA